MNEHRLNMIVACDQHNGIGKNNQIPWNIRSEMKFFQQITSYTRDSTKQNAMIMGRNTWESLKQKPLPNRINVIISRTLDVQGGSKSVNVLIYASVEEALHKLPCDCPNLESMFVIGGGQLYKKNLSHPICTIDTLYYNVIRTDTEMNCDTFFPIQPLNHSEWRVVSCDQTHSEFVAYICKPN